MTTKNTTIRLTNDEQRALTEIAAKSGCTMRNGKPSWRKMLQQIASGKFRLVNRLKP
jgi:hypothetical protein